MIDAQEAIALKPTCVVVIEHGRMPSTDYFIRPYVEALGVPVGVVDSAGPLVDADAVAVGALVVFVRYVEPRWAKAIEATRDHLAGVALFIDDDLLDWRALSGLPIRYRYKIWRLTLQRRSWLQRVKAGLWVSTKYLANKYSSLNAVLVSAAAPQEILSKRSGIRIFYHGTASHAAEISWLAPIMRKVQGRCDDTFFEIFGGSDVNHMYRGIPRTSVLHPMSWPNYQSYTSLGGLDIGLAPLLPGRFSAGRSSTKFLDFVRCGAVGIYSDVAPYAGFVRHGVDGILVRNEPETWVEAIVSLARNSEGRARMTQSAAQRLGAG